MASMTRGGPAGETVTPTTRSFREQSRFRKLTYAGIILGLFTGMIFHRALVDDRASENDLREVDLGDVDLGGSAARYALVSFRGPLVCALWWEAEALKARQDWAQLQLRTRALTKLMPHFKGPWIYLAWEWSYNIAVEFDRIEDKYHYVAEGMQLLAEGERRNRARVYNPEKGVKEDRGDPDMRWELGWYFQQKMTTSDEADLYRCYLQLSCIPPKHWDPDRLNQERKELDLFKQQYPRLVRRIRELRQIPEGAEKRLDEELLTFFRGCRNIPSRFDADGQPLLRFPLWPDERPGDTVPKAPTNTEVEQAQDAHEIARSWYEFSQESLPDPNPDPGPVVMPTREELRRTRKALPSRMMMLVFRGFPCKSRTRCGLDLAKEGFFDDAKKALEDAHRMWLNFGRDNGLWLRPGEEEALAEAATLYIARYPQRAAQGLDPPAEIREAAARNDSYAQKIMLSYYAYSRLTWLGRNREVSVFPHWETTAATYKLKTAQDGQRHFYNAEHRYRSDFRQARAEFEKGLVYWQVLIRPRPDIEFLAPIGYEFSFGAGYAMHLGMWRLTTNFGVNVQSQDEVSEMQAPYMRQMARCEAPERLRTMLLSYGLTRLGAGAVPGQFLATGVAHLVPVEHGISLAAVEQALQTGQYPLDHCYDFFVQQRLKRERDQARRDLAAPPVTMPVTAPKIQGLGPAGPVGPPR